LNAPVIVTPFFSRTRPTAVGLNAINMSQLLPADIPVVQVVETLMKGGLTRMLAIGIARDPELLLSVMVCDGLVRPTITCPKVSGAFGLTRSFGCFTSGDEASSDCANAGRANAVSRNNNRKARPVIDRKNDLKRI
jgi:hypothetical protein